MNIIEEVRRDREDLARVLKKHIGMRRYFEDLYPDRAHFIYELLQNAEDTGATDTKFTLNKQGLVFEHNGRPFEVQDIKDITDVGDPSKARDEDKIGGFGIGFKAVFAYTETPRIWSPTFSFQISEFVLPDELHSIPDLGGVTRFEFPFNSPKKTAQDAYDEILAGLKEIAETTLLFLSHIESITWELDGKANGKVMRIHHSEHHIEVLKKQYFVKEIVNRHYLLFSEPVPGLSKHCASVAFLLEALPKVSEYLSEKPLADQFRIVPAKPGCVAIFFPAKKERSGLRFHLHAPFVPEVSRASIKDTSANLPLFDQLATLMAKSLHSICKMKFLKADFLAVLPNHSDELDEPYKVIREAIVKEMNEQPLTPTHSGGNAPAMFLLQAKTSFKNMLTIEDIEFLVEYDEEPPMWVIGAGPKNSDIDKFLCGLAIREWDVNDIIRILTMKASRSSGLDTKFVEWLNSKSDEWMQRFYAFLYRELEPKYSLSRLTNILIVRLSDGEYNVGSECYFPSEQCLQDELFPRVDRAVYTSGKNEKEQERARSLLVEIGVRDVGESEQIEMILKHRYCPDYFDPKIEDINRFVEFFENEPNGASVFRDYYIFQIGEDNKWSKPNAIFLDNPYLKTGLKAYYEFEGSNVHALSEEYAQVGIEVKRLSKFAKAVGAVTALKISETSCYQNPDWDHLSCVPGERSTSPVNRDYKIVGLGRLLSSSSMDASGVVWTTLMELPSYPNYLKATYQRNRANGAHFSDSQLVHELRSVAWIPQEGGEFVRPADADQTLLPRGFQFDVGWDWLEAIHFGKEVEKKTVEHRRKREFAVELGFEDDESFEDAKWFAQLDFAERERFKKEYERSNYVELPDHRPSNPERRSTKLTEQAGDAPDRKTEQRTRTVSVSREAVKKDAAPYLRQQYTNFDSEMICQVCKDVLPFKLADGSYYFETVEFLPELNNLYYQNYIVLCPNHAAMYKYANSSKQLMKDMFINLLSQEQDIVLADGNTTIWFTETHISDLQAIIAADDSSTTTTTTTTTSP